MADIASTFSRLIRFTPTSSPTTILIGEPVDSTLDIGLAVLEGKEVSVSIFSGSSVLTPGSKTDKVETVSKLLSPLSQSEIGTIRCIGLNYVSHAREMNIDIPAVPTLFLKPDTALSDPYPTATTILPKITQVDGTGDYESEMAIVIGKDAKDVPESEALEYVLGYTASNDVSSRTSQMNQTQWCFSKGFDGSCPLGPALVSSAAVPDVSKLSIRGVKNGVVMQQATPLTDLIFSVEKIVSFLSQGTTLKAGTVILTGTPPGVGAAKTPKEFLRSGDEFRVEISGGVGTLVSRFENQ
ncbi:fumarylacetoacetate hydrolase family protein [Aspergillus stella-maris]|uniref:fumarylacetoacetate hydrolase family protein n=1 Tax=Aspergillus stella-maris TaxID=1810926 RepID=UPI003CCDCCAD